MATTVALCWAVTDDDTDRTTHQFFDPHDELTITNALQVAAQQFHAHQEELGIVKKALDEGEQVAMWAPGESGARAAQHLIEQFHRQEADARRLANKIDGYDEDEEGEDGT